MTLLVFCTLLGPEGPGRRSVERHGAERILWTLLGLTPRVRLTGYRPYFENYTVDASILDSNSNVRIT